MADIKEYNSLLEYKDKNGNVERHYPITRFKNVLGVKELTEKEIAILELLAVNSYIVDDNDPSKTYKIGCVDGKLYVEPSSVSVKDLVNAIKNVLK